MIDLYIAAKDDDGGVYHYKTKEDFGDLKLVKKYDIEMPMYMRRDGDIMHFITKKSPFDDCNGGYMNAKIAEDGSLYDFSEKVSTLGEDVCHLCVDENAVYCANYSSGSICKIGGKLVKHSGVTGPNKDRQDKPYAHYINASPDGKYILVCDLGLDKILVYDKDLNYLSSSEVPPGHGARMLEFSKDGKTVYCVNELSGAISVFDYYNGKIEHIKTYASLPDEWYGHNTGAAIRISDDEKYIYISNRGHDSIAVFEVKNSKELRLRSVIPCGGEHPRDFNIYGDYLICANMYSDNIVVFERTGASLVKTGVYNVPGGPLCVAF